MIAFAALAFPEFSPFVFVIPEIDLGFFVFGPLPIRWYAVSYLIGVFIGIYYSRKIIARPKLYGGAVGPITNDDMDEALTWAFLGGFLGGRLGYILFYTILPPVMFGKEPTGDLSFMSLIRVWEGGLSFHGGFIGVCVAIFLVARVRKLPLWSLADIWAMLTPIVIFSVRVFGNFVNAELYGRHTDSSLGMIFPEGYTPNNSGPPVAYDAVEKAWVYLGTEIPRHPSQLYEGVLEGLIPAILLAVLAWRFKILKRPGLATGIFFIMYGIGRSIAENFREPDAHIGFLPGEITMGMLLSFPIWIVGAWLIWRAVKNDPLSAKA